MIEGLVEEGMPPFDIRNWTEQVLVHTIGHGCGIMGNATNAIFHNFPLSSGTSCFLNKLIHTSFIHLLGWPLTSSLVTLLVMICNFLFVSIHMAKYLTNHSWCYEPTLPNAKSSSFSSTLLIGINSCQPRNIAAFSYPNAHSGGRPKFSPEHLKLHVYTQNDWALLSKFEMFTLSLAPAPSIHVPIVPMLLTPWSHTFTLKQQKNVISGVIQVNSFRSHLDPFFALSSSGSSWILWVVPHPPHPSTIASKKPCCRSLHTIKHPSAAPEGEVLARHPRHPQATHPEVRHLKLVPHAKWDPPGDVWRFEFSNFFPFFDGFITFSWVAYVVSIFFHRNFHQQRTKICACAASVAVKQPGPCGKAIIDAAMVGELRDFGK